MEAEKLAAAKEALKLVEKGQVVGLGSGSTASLFISLLGKENRKRRLRLRCIATSKASERQARRLGLKIVGFGEVEKIDIAFDGADQVDEELNLIKGLGGALVREKIVDYRAERFVVMVGPSKRVWSLSGIVPVEVIPLAEEAVRRDLALLGAKSALTRKAGKKKFVSDNGNLIIDAEFPEIKDAACLEDKINSIPGVVDNGIFAHKKPTVIVGEPDFSVKILR
ncbi:MAG: ribose-5-phosphate isomerase RpiA [Candidatus Micrarchaeota archaeon]|nr:ribose-5-phosphate isomerase RpiA [Candidatus Micrarchaeota archaeon]